MYEINALLNKYGKDSEQLDVLSIVPMHILQDNGRFYEYIRNSNNKQVFFSSVFECLMKYQLI
jgi:hypothetical protein